MARPRKTTGTCGYCKGERPNHKAFCKLAHPELRGKKRRPVTRRPPKGPKKGKPTTGRMDELEIPALAAVLEALTPLEFDAKRRVLDYVCRRFTIDPAKLAA